MVKFHTTELPDGNYQIVYDEPGFFTVNKKKFTFPAGNGGVLESLDSIKDARAFYIGPDVFINKSIGLSGNICIVNSKIGFTSVEGVAKITALILKNVAIIDSEAYFAQKIVSKANVFRSQLSKCNVSRCIIENSYGTKSSIYDSSIVSSKIEAGNILLSHVEITEISKTSISESTVKRCTLNDCTIQTSILNKTKLSLVNVYSSTISNMDYFFVLPTEVIRYADISDGLDYAIIGLSFAYKRKNGNWFFMTRALYQFATELDSTAVLSVNSIEKKIGGNPSNIALDYYYADVKFQEYSRLFDNSIFKNHKDRFLSWLKKYAFMSHLFCTSLLVDFGSSISNIISDKLLFDIKTKHVAHNVVLFDKKTLRTLTDMRISYADLASELEKNGAVVI
jgi:hypothetical protein